MISLDVLKVGKRTFLIGYKKNQTFGLLIIGLLIIGLLLFVLCKFIREIYICLIFYIE